MRKALLSLAMLAGALAPAQAQGEKISIMPGDDPTTVAYSPCEPSEESGECLAYLLSCRTSESYGSGLELMLIGQGGGAGSKPDIPAIARTFLDKPYGEARLRFTVGGKPADITAHFILVTGNELNGDWDLTVRTMDPGGLLDALTPDTSSNVVAEMGDFNVQLAASKADGDVLMKFKQACTQ